MDEETNNPSRPSLVGKAISSYQVLSRIGFGGMGEVYLAHDKKLDRRVAVKTLSGEFSDDSELLSRLRQEAKVLATLNHPNVVSIYDVGQVDSTPYIVMELVEGTTLRQALLTGRVPIKRLLHVATQVADGLAKVHDAQILHRDLKPENVMLTKDGFVKILDFGLAKHGRSDNEISEATMITGAANSNAIRGTAGYMSPEQACGRPVDVRTDQFSFGCILYEMATGKRAFQRATPIETLSAIINEEPVSMADLVPDLPAPLCWIVQRCLSKDPSGRYESTRDLARDLQNLRDQSSVGSLATPGPPQQRAVWRAPRVAAGLVLAALLPLLVWLNVGGLRDRFLAPAADAQIQSLAVLPLEYLSKDPAEDYFTDGMTEALTTSLMQIRSLHVTSRSSAMRYKGSQKSAAEIARELQVDAALEGTIAVSGGKVRIAAHLISGATNRSLWAKDYERGLSDVLGLQNEVARAIAEGIRINVTPEVQARLAMTPSVNPEAHEAYLKGRFYRNRRGLEATRTSVDYFKHAIDLDPNHAQALAGLADAYTGLATFAVGFMDPKEAFPKARDLALKAMAIDNNLAQAHAALAFVKDTYDWDWEGSEGESLRAIDLNPSYFEAFHQYSHLLTAMGRTAESLDMSQRALGLDSLDLAMNTHLGWHYFSARQYEQAIEQLRRTIALDDNYPLPKYYLGLVYEQTGRLSEAIGLFQKAFDSSRENVAYLAGLGHAYALAGKKIEARRILDELNTLSKSRYVSAYNNAVIHLALGDKDQALSWLQKAVDERSSWVIYFRVEPRLDPLRTDPRFIALLEKIPAMK